MEKHLKTAATLAKLLDNQFKIGPFRFGIDPLIGLIPWIGDAAGLILAGYLIWIGHQMKLPREKLLKMYAYVLADFVIGLIPWVGDVADFAFKANSKNLEIISS